MHRRAAEVHAIAVGAEGVAQQRVGVELRPVLAEHGDARRGFALRDHAGVGREVAGEQADERRFPAPVRAQQPETIAGAEREVDVAEERARPHGFRDALGDEEFAGSPIRGIEIDARRRSGGDLVPRAEVLQLVDAVVAGADASLGLRAARLGPSRQPFEILSHLIGQRLLLAGLAVEELPLAPEELGVVPVDAERSLRVRGAEFDHAGGDALEEDAVVRDEDRGERLLRPGRAQEQVFEPGDAIQIEVVRRLVKQQHVGLTPARGQRARDGQSLAPPARERFGPSARVRLVEAEALQDHIGEHLCLVALVGAPCAERGLTRRAAGRDALPEQVMLGHVHGADALPDDDRAVVGTVLPGQQLEKGALACAVGADEPDAVALGDGHRHPAEERPKAV